MFDPLGRVGRQDQWVIDAASSNMRNMEDKMRQAVAIADMRNRGLQVLNVGRALDRAQAV